MGTNADFNEKPSIYMIRRNIELSPPEINSSHSIEFLIVGSKEFSESFHGALVDLRVAATFRLAETTDDGRRSTRITHETRKTGFDGARPEV